jgi:hypothetical protein
MPFKSKKQERFFQAIAHGMKPRKGGPSKAVARKFISDSQGYAGGGRITGSGLEALTGRAPRSPGPGKASTLGSTARVGALGASVYAGSGLAAKPTRPGAALSGRPATRAKTPPSKTRPRPGRGVNPRLALSGTVYHEAKDRLDRLHTQARKPR